MNELYTVMGFFVLIGLLVSRMRREQRPRVSRQGHRNQNELTPVNQLRSLANGANDSTPAKKSANPPAYN